MTTGSEKAKVQGHETEILISELEHLLCFVVGLVCFGKAKIWVCRICFSCRYS